MTLIAMENYVNSSYTKSRMPEDYLQCKQETWIQ